MSKRVDVVIVGGGPAGSTAGALLARQGRSVRLLEKDHFPRFHIGESLLPAELPVFERLGLDAGNLPAVRKAGADFLDEDNGRYARYLFQDALDGTPEHAWQVERSVFDQALLECARAAGVEVRHGARATTVEVGEAYATVHTTGESVEARYVVDATGRDRLLARQHRSYEPIEGFGRAAVWAHFSGLEDRAVQELEETGNIIVLVFDEGWGWVIPLAGARLSVGFVSARKGIVCADWFDERFSCSPLLRRLTRGAARGEVQLLGDYSYRNRSPYGARWGCIGDASCFLDPVFSSGVALAMVSGETLADLLAPAFAEGREGEPDLLRPLYERMERAYGVFGSLIHRFYHTRMVDHIFFCDEPEPELRAGLISVLAADLWRDDNRFQQMLLRSAPRRPRHAAR